MTSLCDPRAVHALHDGELDPRTATLLRQHLGGCVDCQEVFQEALLIDVLADGHGFSPITVELPAVACDLSTRTTRSQKRVWGARVALVAGGLAIAAGLLVFLRGTPPSEQAVFASLAAGPRRYEWRLAYPPADRHRPYDGPRSTGPNDRTALLDLSSVERAGDERALAAAQLLAGMSRQAEGHLRRLTSKADGRGAIDRIDVMNDHAVALLVRKADAEALALLDRVLADRPDHPQALWNKALVLESHGDPTGAAQLFARVARLGEPGWADEARTRGRQPPVAPPEPPRGP